MNKLLVSLCGLLAPASLLALSAADTPPASPATGKSSELAEVQNFTSDILRSVTCVQISADGKFLYAAAFNAAAVTVFNRDTESGQLEIVESQENPELRGVVSVRLSADGKSAIAAAFVTGTITLFDRDAATGKLLLLDVVHREGEGGNGLNFVTDARFSADGRFVYTAASNGVGVYKVEDGKLTYVETQTAEGGLRGVRAAALSANGEWVYAAGAQSGTVGALHRDPNNGKLEVGSLLADGANGVDTLGGAFRTVCSGDGKHLYVSSGRFGGDQAISVFGIESSGDLKFIEAHVDGEDDFSDFKGGNDIVVSPDGKFVYAVGSISDSLVRFQRDEASGKLTFLGSQAVGKRTLPGSAGLCFSPDGRFVYVADEMASSIVVLKQP